MPRQQPSSPKKKRKQLDFEDWYEIAKKYYEEHGDLLVPRIYEDEEGHILDLLDKEEIKYRSEKRLLGYRNKGKRRLAGNANQPIIISIDDVADIIDVRAEDEFARVELLVSLKQELERLSPRELMIIRTYLDYPIEVVARKLKVRPNTISKARRKIARELRKKLV